MKKWEQKIANYQRWKIVPDIIRWTLIIGVLCVVFYLIYTSGIWGSIVWAILWIPIGFILLLNIIGFLTLPLYRLFVSMTRGSEEDFIQDFIDEHKERQDQTDETK